MNEYVVSLKCIDNVTTYFTIYCWADDIENAEAQAYYAYPGAIILGIEQI